MSRVIGSEIPELVRSLLTGDELETREGVTFLLASVTDDGWPHMAMFSVGEIVALDSRVLRLALWPDSVTSSNLTRQGRAILVVVQPPAAYYLQCSVTRHGDLDVAGRGRLAAFELRLEEVREDTVAYAVLTNGVTHRLTDRDELVRWRQTVTALRSAGW